MLQSNSSSLKTTALGCIAATFVLCLHGAVPFLLTPTLGQAIWTMGFAKSLALGPWYSLHPHNFGIPASVSIPFGLAGALPASWLLRLGLSSSDAYAAMAALWLLTAFFAAVDLMLLFHSSRGLAIVGAVAWMSMPTIWAHSGYSMLSLGIALLPFYFLATLKLIYCDSLAGQIRATIYYVLAVLISVFMDGYTFVMFFMGSTIILLWKTYISISKRRRLLTTAFPLHVGSFCLAYIAFTKYLGTSSFDYSSIDFFRGWGADVIFFVVPSGGISWLLDTVGLSVERSNKLYYGDSSVWNTTFVLPVLVLAIFAYLNICKKRSLATAMLIIACVGFYMALGPSLKVNSTKPLSVQLLLPRSASVLMPAQNAVAATGTGYLSEYLPGFKSMRASYRWSALGIFALWALVGIWAASSRHPHNGPFFALTALIFVNMPYLPNRIESAADNRKQFYQIDEELVGVLRQKLTENEKVLFVPLGNDFFANYLAPSANFKTYNVGGDKNLEVASAKWPTQLRNFSGKINIATIPALRNILVEGIADAIVIPYFDMLWSAHLWPCRADAKFTIPRTSEELAGLPDFECPVERKVELAPLITALQNDASLDISDEKMFASVRLRPGYLDALHNDFVFPIKFGSGFTKSSYLLRSGWYLPEASGVWSGLASKLVVPVPTICQTKQCSAVLTFNVYGGSEQSPQIVFVRKQGVNSTDEEKIISKGKGSSHALIHLDSNLKYQELEIMVPNATSPKILEGSEDPRILGVSLLDLGLLVD